MTDRRDLTLTLPDGRTLGWAEFGPEAGVPLLLLHGTPGGRLNRLGDDELYDRLGIRLIVPDRAGYGRSTEVPGRTVCSYAEDLVALLDHLALRRVPVLGGSGGGPHALGLSVLAPERVSVCGVMVGASPLEEDEALGQVSFNVEVWKRVHDVDALTAWLAQGRETALTKGLVALLADAPPEDLERLNHGPAAERSAEVIASCLEPGVAGWRDDYRALWALDWGFAPADVNVPVLWWHGDVDRNVPPSAAMRVISQLPQVTFHQMSGGHLAGRELLPEIFGALTARALQSETAA